MPIKLTLKELLDAKPALEKIVKQDIDIAQSFKLAKYIRELNEHFKDYDDQRVSLVRRLGKEDQETGNFEVKDPEKKEFVSEMGKLLDIKVELKFEPLNLSDFEGVKLSPGDALALEKLFNI